MISGLRLRNLKVILESENDKVLKICRNIKDAGGVVTSQIWNSSEIVTNRMDYKALAKKVSEFLKYSCRSSFRAVSGSQQNWVQSTKSSHTPPIQSSLPSPHNLFIIPHTRAGHLLYQWANIDRLLSSRVHSSSWCHPFCNFDKCIMTYTLHHVE